MGDHFVLLVDRLLTESTLEAAIESRNQSNQGMPLANKHDIIDFSSHRMDDNVGSSPRKFVECRICHVDDQDLNMDIPRSCRGSLKYAHSKCVQRWCNEKGDIICEICHQFMVLLVLRHTLPILISGAGDYSLTLFTLLVLRVIGIMLPT